MRLLNLTFLVLTLVFLVNESTYARRGCCSWHRGVASCDTRVGRLICRDGTYSPSCTCEMTQPVPEKNNSFTNDRSNSDSNAPKENPINWYTPPYHQNLAAYQVSWFFLIIPTYCKLANLLKILLYSPVTQLLPNY